MAFTIDFNGNVELQIYDRLLPQKEDAEKRGGITQQGWSDFAQVLSITAQVNLVTGSPAEIAFAEEFAEKTRTFITSPLGTQVKINGSLFTLSNGLTYMCTPEEAITMINQDSNIQYSDVVAYKANPGFQTFYA